MSARVEVRGRGEGGERRGSGAGARLATAPTEVSFLEAGFSNAAPLSNLAILSSNFAFFNASFPVFGGGAFAAF